jgi:DtxR family transcriptional regulator, Mn-dependent transcriptional regulator
MNESTQEYLEALYNLTQNGQTATTTQIAARLKVTPASVSEMLGKLADSGYINHPKYQGVTLTQKGFELAEKMTRKHRLLERFLYDVLKIKKDRVHNEACQMEHVLSDDAERAMCQTLRVPYKCPDDQNVIPPCNLDFATCEECRKWNDDLEKVSPRKKNVSALSGLKEKQKATIAFIRGDDKAMQRLLDLGMTPGTKISVCRIAPMKGPMEVDVRGSRLALGEDVACNVFVENPS